MAVYFLDSSAAVKLYVHEVGSDWMGRLARTTSEHQFVVARIAAAEIAAALYRRVRAGTLHRADADQALDVMQESFEHTMCGSSK